MYHRLLTQCVSMHRRDRTTDNSVVYFAKAALAIKALKIYFPIFQAHVTWDYLTLAVFRATPSKESLSHLSSILYTITECFGLTESFIPVTLGSALTVVIAVMNLFRSALSSSWSYKIQQKIKVIYADDRACNEIEMVRPIEAAHPIKKLSGVHHSQIGNLKFEVHLN